MDTNTTAENSAPITQPETEPTKPTKKIDPKLATIVVVILVVAGLAFYFKNLWIAATVDGHIVTRYAVVKRLESQGGKSTLDTLIENQLVNNEAKKNNVTVTEDDINKKLDTIKSQVESSGTTFEEALTNAGMTLSQLKEQVALQLKLEKLLGDKVIVTDDEVNKYITDNKIPLATGQEEETKNQIRDQLKSDKFSNAASTFIDDLKSKAKIKTYVNY